MDVSGVVFSHLHAATPAKNGGEAHVSGPNFRDALADAAAPESSEKIKNAAKQFEGLIIGQLLKSVHESSSDGWMGTGDDQTGSTAIELAEEQFAQAMASGGGLGLAKMVEKGLAKPPKSSQTGLQ